MGKRFLEAAEMDLHGDLNKRMRKVDCPVCQIIIILEAVTNEGDVIFCPHCETKLVVSGFNKKPSVHRIDFYGST